MYIEKMIIFINNLMCNLLMKQNQNILEREPSKILEEEQL